MVPPSRVYIFLLAVTFTRGQIFTLKDGNVGVNFAGFRASAGLGGLLTGDLSKGGLHAEAGTPFGQSAAAGLGGGIGGNGAAAGRLYAGATAGNGVSAAAGLEGAADDTGYFGSSAAGAAAGGAVKAVEKSSFSGVAASAPETPYTSGIHVEKYVNTVPVQPVVIEKTFVRRPHHFNKIISAKFQSRFNNVPVTQVIKVEGTTTLAPVIIHKHVPASPAVVKVVEHIYTDPAPATVVVHKYVNAKPVHGGLLARLFANVNSDGSSEGAVSHEVHASAAAPSSFQSTATVGASKNLFNDIFNIPISTLSAVNRLVNNIVGGGSVSVTKTAHAY